MMEDIKKKDELLDVDNLSVEYLTDDAIVHAVNEIGRAHV